MLTLLYLSGTTHAPVGLDVRKADIGANCSNTADGTLHTLFELSSQTHSRVKRKRSLVAMDRATVDIIIYVLNEQKIRDDVDVEEWFTLRDWDIELARKTGLAGNTLPAGTQVKSSQWQVEPNAIALNLVFDERAECFHLAKDPSKCSQLLRCAGRRPGSRLQVRRDPRCPMDQLS